MESIRLRYFTQDGEETFDFCFEELAPNEWRIYILSQPPYGTRSQHPNTTHCQYDEKGKYVDWSYPPESLEQAKQIASLWAESTHDYIKNEPKKKYNPRKKYNFGDDPEDPFAQEDSPDSLAGDLHDWLDSPFTFSQLKSKYPCP